MSRCDQADRCAFDPGCDNYAMTCSTIEADEREIVERRRPEIEAEMLAGLAERLTGLTATALSVLEPLTIDALNELLERLTTTVVCHPDRVSAVRAAVVGIPMVRVVESPDLPDPGSAYVFRRPVDRCGICGGQLWPGGCERGHA